MVQQVATTSDVMRKDTVSHLAVIAFPTYMLYIAFAEA